MSGLILTCKRALPASVDVSALQPRLLAGKTVREVAALPLLLGNETLRVGDLFRVSGKSDGEHLTFAQADSRLVGVGAGLAGGEILVEGNVGAHAGRGLRAGTLRVQGGAGDSLGAGMRGGLIDVAGSAGDFAGGPIPGELTGMRGGTLLIGKDVGQRCGERQRRGLIAVGGNAGAHAGSQLIAGTLVVRGSCAPGVGHGMRRGSILIAQPAQPPGTCFTLTGSYALPFLTLLVRHLGELKPRWRKSLVGFLRVQRWVGDAGNGGLGEILLPD